MQPLTNCLLLRALVIILIVAAYCSTSVSAAAATEEDGRALKYYCTIHQIASMSARGEPAIPHKTVCKKKNRENYLTLGGNIDAFFLRSYFPLELGRTQLSIPISLLIDTDANGKHINLDDPRASEMIVIRPQNRNRRVNHRVGSWKVLAIRVIDSTGDAPTKSVSELGTDIFDDAFNLVSRLFALILILIASTGYLHAFVTIVQYLYDSHTLYSII